MQDVTRRVETLMATAEAVLVAVVGRLACWLAPLPSAFLVSRATSSIFDLAGFWPVVFAAGVELIGLVVGNLWTEAKAWNMTKRKGDPAANERFALGLFASYFVVTFVLLFAVEIVPMLGKGAALLFPALSAVAILAMNERIKLNSFKMEAAQDRQEKREKRQQNRQKRQRQPAIKPMKTATAKPAATATAFAVGATTKDRAAAILTQRSDISGAELGRQLGRSASLGRQLKRELLPMIAGNNGAS